MPSSPSESHQRQAAVQGPLTIALVTVSDTRTPETDVNGRYLREQIESAGHRVHASEIVPDEPARIDESLEALLSSPAVDVILFNGGTGVSRRDRTFDVLERRVERPLPGFGELFRMLSFEQVGSAAMLSRALAGVCRGKVIFSTPGSPAAVQLAWERLISRELQHLVWELRK